MYLKHNKRINKFDELVCYFYSCEKFKEGDKYRTKTKYLCSICEDEFNNLEKFSSKMNEKEFKLFKKHIYLIQKKAGAING